MRGESTRSPITAVICGLLLLVVQQGHVDGSAEEALKKYRTEYDSLVIVARDSLRLAGPIDEVRFDRLAASYELTVRDLLAVAESADLLLSALAKAEPLEASHYTIIARVELLKRGELRRRVYFQQDGVARVDGKALRLHDRDVFARLWRTATSQLPIVPAD
jgi:hypothetical protein